QYTRNMVTAASGADAAVVLVDATKLDVAAADIALLAQTRRHALLAALLRVPSLVFAVNKLDAVPDAASAFARIRAALQAFAQEAGLAVRAIVPISALQGWNVVEPRADWCDYRGPSLLALLEDLPVAAAPVDEPFALPVQWVEKPSAQTEIAQGRRVFWGRVAAGAVAPGQAVTVLPGGQSATVMQVLDHVRQGGSGRAGASVGLVLDRELDISRGDWLLAPGAHPPAREIEATVAWLDDEPLTAQRVYWALHGHRWVKARVTHIAHRLNVDTLAEEEASELAPNAIGHVTLALQEPLAVRPYTASRALGALVLVDTATHRTAAAVLVR
ncbi:MAG TPA: GTP-binding protein, partial [Ottowia sp.]|nr:GTP-binding protein [Ottowia sp.]